MATRKGMPWFNFWFVPAVLLIEAVSMGFPAFPPAEVPEVVAPVKLDWGLAMGGIGIPFHADATVDPAGNVIVTGKSGSLSCDFPTINAGGLTFSSHDDSFLAKFSPSGECLWSVPVLTDLWVRLTSVTTDSEGNIFVAGDRHAGAYEHDPSAAADSYVFVAKYSPDGARLWSCSYGPGLETEYEQVLVDGEGRIFVFSRAEWPDWAPTPGLAPYSEEVYTVLSGVSPDGSGVLWTTHLEGDVFGLDMNADGEIVVGSDTYPQFWMIRDDIIVTKIRGHTDAGHQAGSAVWRTVLGGSEDDEAQDPILGFVRGHISFDGAGNTIVSGITESPDFPLSEKLRNRDSFVAKLDAGGQLIWVRRFGTAGGGQLTNWTKMAVDASGNTFMAAPTPADGLPTPGGFQHELDTSAGLDLSIDVYIAKISPGGAVVWASYLGGPWADTVFDVQVDTAGNLLIMGEGTGPLPPPNGFAQNAGPERTAFVAKITAGGQLDWSACFYANVGAYPERLLPDGGGGLYVTGEGESAIDAIDVGGFTHIGPLTWGAPWQYDIIVARIVTVGLTIVTDSLPGGTVNVPYSKALEAHGAVPPCAWSIESGDLPAGLALDAATGVISGTPSASTAAHFTVRLTDSAFTDNTTTKEFDLTVIDDNDGPAVSGAAAVPTAVREQVDLAVTLAASASDADTGGVNVTAAEYFIGAAGDPGTCTPVAAADGAFDSPAEALTATVDTSAWTVAGGAKTVSVRAKDAAGNWGPLATLSIAVVDGVAPAPITNLSLYSIPDLTKITGRAWETAGTPDEAEETITLDLGEERQVGAAGILADGTALFPRRLSIALSADGGSWKTVASEADYKCGAGLNLWTWQAEAARFVRVTATARYDKTSRMYRVKVAEVSAFESRGGNSVAAGWVATGDDASAGTASRYNLRYSADPITEANFDAAWPVEGLAAPQSAATSESAAFSVGGHEGTLYAAIKAIDEAGNTSGISNVARVDVTAFGLHSDTEDEMTVSADAVPTFDVSRGADVAAAYIAFSGSASFPAGRAASGAAATPRFRLNAGKGSWTPTASQWRIVKRLVTQGTAYWRLEGKGASGARFQAGGRALLFSTGDITDLAVSPAHLDGGSDAVWPGTTPPAFSWTNGTTGMVFFYVDVATGQWPLSTAARTVKLGTGKATGGTYTPTAREWKKVRKLASLTGGTLYWRVRAKDKDKALTVASAAKVLVIDAGDWTLSDLTPAIGAEVSWSTTAQGFASFVLQVSSNEGFDGGAKKVIRVPGVPVKATSYKLTAADVRRIKALAARTGAETLFYRVRAADADGAFVAYSDAKATPAP